jgi:hypothetical protein
MEVKPMLDNVFSLTSNSWTTPAFWGAVSLAVVSSFSVIAFKRTRSSVALAWAKADKHAAIQDIVKIENIDRAMAIEETSDSSEETPTWLHAITTDEKQLLADRLSSLPGNVQAPQKNLKDEGKTNLTDEGRRWLEMVEHVNPRLNHNAANQPVA